MEKLKVLAIITELVKKYLLYIHNDQYGKAKDCRHEIEQWELFLRAKK